MAGANVSVSAKGYSYPPHVKPQFNRDGNVVAWHKVECPVPNGKCLDHPLKLGCAKAPAPEEQ